MRPPTRVRAPNPGPGGAQAAFVTQHGRFAEQGRATCRSTSLVWSSWLRSATNHRRGPSNRSPSRNSASSERSCSTLRPTPVGVEKALKLPWRLSALTTSRPESWLTVSQSRPALRP